MDSQLLLGIAIVGVLLVVAWNFAQSKRMDRLQQRIAALEKK